MSMAVVATDHAHWTAADLRAIPDDRNRYEIIDGELFVTPSASVSHQLVLSRLFGELLLYLRAEPVGRVWTAPADIILAADTVVQPDLFVLPVWLRPREWADIQGRLLLAIEVLSPSTARRDRGFKRERYQRARIPEYWVVDPRTRRVERWRADDTQPEILTDVLRWHPDPAHPALAIDLPALFREVLDGFE